MQALCSPFRTMLKDDDCGPLERCDRWWSGRNDFGASSAGEWSSLTEVVAISSFAKFGTICTTKSHLVFKSLPSGSTGSAQETSSSEMKLHITSGPGLKEYPILDGQRYTYLQQYCCYRVATLKHLLKYALLSFFFPFWIPSPYNCTSILPSIPRREVHGKKKLDIKAHSLNQQSHLA